jgi:hypothetical protein
MNNIEDAEDAMMDAMMDEMFGDGPRVPSIRIFRVRMEGYPETSQELFVYAHSVTCDGDAAKFFVYRQQMHQGEMALAAYSNRTLRPYIDIEDVTEHVAITSSTRLN